MKKLVATLIMVIMVLSMSVLFTACGASVTLSSPENVTFDGTTITWDAVENADQYRISINDNKEKTVSKNSYKPTGVKGEEFTVKIIATNTTARKVTEGETVVTFTPLDTIEDVTWSETGVASWSEIDGATGYLVKIDNNVSDIAFGETAYEDLPIGQHTFSVRAVVEDDPSYYSVWSTPKTVTKLGTVDKESITYKDGAISWTSVVGALKYEVVVNGEAHEVTSSSYEFDSFNQDFDVTVKPIGNGTNVFTGTACELKRFTYLGTVTGIRIIDGILRWDEVAGATGYELKLNNVPKGTLTACEYKGIPANTSTSVTIRPISTDSTYFSSWSAVETVLVLPAPVLRWNNDIELDGQEGNNLYWDLVGQAEGYTIKIEFENEEPFIDDNISSIQTYYPYAFIKEGNYKVYLKSNASETATNVSDSVYSEPISITRLKAPTPAENNYVTSTAEKLADGFTVTFKAPTGGATGYKLYKDSVLVSQSTSTQFIERGIVEDNITTEQTFNYAIQAIGGYNASTKKVTLSSLSSKNLSFSIKVLAVPANVVMDGYKVKYGQVGGAEGYSINTGASTLPSGSLEYDLSALNAGDYDVRVCAKGNGETVLASNFSAPIKVHRLEYPTNIRYEEQGPEQGIIECNKVNYATSHDVYFNMSNIAATTTVLENVYQEIKEEGTYVHMTAVANYYNTAHTDYYMTSKESPSVYFIKLKAPEFGNVSFTNDNFMWNHSGNMNTAEYTPTYEVANSNGVVHNGNANGTNFAITHFEGGAEYSFKVRAIGNGTKYVSSEWSETKTIYKLATPDVVRNVDRYEWNAVDGTSNYAVYVDGELMSSDNVHVSGKKYEYVHNFKLPGEYQVKVVAVGDNGNTTINSNDCIIEQVVEQLPTPDIRVTYSNPNGYIETGKIKVEVINIDGNDVWANGYLYAVGGASTPNSAETEYEFVPNGTGRHYVSVQANGGRFDNDGVYWATSQSQGGAGTSYYIDLLAAPSVESIQVRGEFLEWATINNFTAYEVEVAVNGGAFGTVHRVTSTKKSISQLIQEFIDGGAISSWNDVITLSVRIRNQGDGNQVITSELVEKTLTVH